MYNGAKRRSNREATNEGECHAETESLSSARASGILNRSAHDDATGTVESTPGARYEREAMVRAELGHRVTEAGTIVGTPAFMAPEQAERGSPHLSVSADVYGLGAILYYILTGSPPRDGTPSEVLEQLAHHTPPPPHILEPRLSPDLVRICMAALAGDPSERLGSATVLADSVDGYLEGRSSSLPPARDAEFLRGYSSRHYPRPSVTVDVVLMTIPDNGAARVALLCRPHPPFVGTWGCPGTFVPLEEPLEETARRVLRDKIRDPDALALDQIGAFGDPKRDPRTRVITVAYLALVARTFQLPQDSGTMRWFDIREGEQGLILRATDAIQGSGQRIELAFDHGMLLMKALRAAQEAKGRSL